MSEVEAHQYYIRVWIRGQKVKTEQTFHLSATSDHAARRLAVVFFINENENTSNAKISTDILRKD